MGTSKALLSYCGPSPSPRDREAGTFCKNSQVIRTASQASPEMEEDLLESYDFIERRL